MFEDAYQLLVNKKDVSALKKKKPKKKKINKDELVKRLRVDNSIKCYSKTETVPNPIEGFECLNDLYNVPTFLTTAFSRLGYKTPTAVQMQALPTMLERHNVLTLAPTGSGKTVAFLVPIVLDLLAPSVQRPHNTPHSVIISPTLELCKQIYQELLCLLDGHNSGDDAARTSKINIVLTSKQLKNFDKPVDILISTPLRLKNLLRTSENEKNKFDLARLRWLVLDESDKLMEDGVNSFQDQVKAVYEACSVGEELRVALFSATQTTRVWSWVKESLGDNLVYVRVGALGAATTSVSQQLRYCSNETMKLQEMEMLFSGGRLRSPCLVFVDRVESAHHLHDILKRLGVKFHIKVDLISSELGNEARRAAVERFREGQVHFLICTSLIARGIDFKGIETVLNYDLPKLREEYIHRVGRAGRAGQTGSAISLWTDDDVVNGLPEVLHVMEASGQPINNDLLQLVKKKQKENRYAGDHTLKKLKQKYRTTEDDDCKKVKKMRPEDRKKMMFLERCVKRKKVLKKCNNIEKNMLKPGSEQ